MASITQTIPSFTGGISQQPDELVLPGQVKDLVNGIPDITDGLVKRPGSRFISPLINAAAGTWFSYYRDESEGAYIGQIQRDGTVKVWHANNVTINGVNKLAGDPATVTGSAASYLTHTTDEDLKFLTIADTTFVTNRTKTVEKVSSAKSPDRAQSIGDAPVNPQERNRYQAFIELRQLAHGREYSFDVHTPTAPIASITSSGGKALNIRVVASSGFTTISRGHGSNTYTGIDPTLQHQTSEIFLAEVGNAKNLVFRLTVTGQVAISSNADGTTESTDYVGVYNTNVELLSGGYGWAQNQQFTVQTSTGTQHAIAINEIQEIKAKSDLGFFRPDPTSFDANLSISADGILSQVTKGTSLGQINLNVVEVIGNGIFLAHNEPFVVETKQPDLWRIVPMEVNDPSELPRQCKHGMIVKVINSSASQEDDFYLKFVGDAGDDGPGIWEETLGIDLHTTFNADTMPHIIQRQANGTFTVGSHSWATREVGDDETNPFPSIVDRKISQTFFHRNRLGFLCEDNIILSRAGDDKNFFNQTALIIGASDPIDIQVSSTQPTSLKNAIETNTGLVVFAETQQFLLHTDSDTLTPETAKVSNISTYRYSPSTDPISLGTTLAFVDSAGRNGRFFEMYDIRREGEPNIVEQSKVVPSLLPNDLDLITNSRENSTIFLSKKASSTIFGYRYFNTGDKRVQSAWFKWTLPFNIQHLFVLDDELFIIEAAGDSNSGTNLLSIPLQELDTAREAAGDDFYGNSTTYNVHLDSSLFIQAGSYDGTHTPVSFFAPGSGVGTKLGAVNLTTGETFIEDTTQRNAPTYKFFGDFGGDIVVVGWLYEMKVDIPRIYVKQRSGEITTSDLTSALTIQRVNLRFGPVGQIDIDLARLGKPTVSIQYDATPMNFYKAAKAPFVEEKTQQVPVYERNRNCNITLKSFHPGPASFHSLTWEGDYTPMFHKRV